jgi:hypothetical protein
MALKDETDQTRDAADGHRGDERVAPLRGAGVSVDAARVGRVALVLGLAAIVLVAAVLLVAGVRKNSQIDTLRADPVPVDLVVSHCIALMGGSGSNAAGYECTGTYTFHGQRYTEGVPGSALYESGATVHGIVAASDPGLFSTTGTVDGERSSPQRVLLPAVVLVVTLAFGAWLVVRRRRHRAG